MDAAILLISAAVMMRKETATFKRGVIMARLQDLREDFMSLNWASKVHFIECYRTKRYNDLNTVQEFDLSKKTKSTKAREVKAPREKGIRKILKKELEGMTPEQLSLLKQLGVC